MLQLPNYNPDFAYCLQSKDFIIPPQLFGLIQRIDKKARIKTDQWRGYIPLKEEFKIKQVYSKSGQNLKELHNF